jgi:hypothetical protein
MDDDFEFQSLQASRILSIEVTFPIGNSPSHVVLGNDLINEEGILSLKVIGSKLLRILA